MSRGGKRKGAGRKPTGKTKPIRVPIDLADWIPSNLDAIRRLKASLDK